MLRLARAKWKNLSSNNTHAVSQSLLLIFNTIIKTNEWENLKVRDAGKVGRIQKQENCRDQGQQVALEKESCSSTFTDLTVCVIKFDIYKKKKKGKKGRCRYFRKTAVAAPTFGWSARSLKMHEICLFFLLLVVSFKRAVRLNTQLLFEKNQRTEITCQCSKHLPKYVMTKKTLDLVQP